MRADPPRWPKGGFTLLEMCVVLLILGILMGVIAPGMQSAFVEAGLRSDARELTLMVKTGMLRSIEEDRPYIMDLGEKKLSLSSVAPATSSGSDAPAPSILADFNEDWPMDAKNVLMLPDGRADGKWQTIESAQWVFRPGELCPASAVCLVRGSSRLEIRFNALTGNVEAERSIFQ